MAVYQTHTCENCGNEFGAVDGASAEQNGYCSPACETEGKGL